MKEIEIVEKLATLARLSIPDERKEPLAHEFESILAYIGQLDSLTLIKTSTPPVPVLHNVVREDTNAYAPKTWTEKIVQLFPAKTGNALSVKKIISNE